MVSERPNSEGVNWIGDAYPVNADPERDTWNGQPIPKCEWCREPLPLCHCGDAVLNAP